MIACLKIFCCNVVEWGTTKTKKVRLSWNISWNAEVLNIRFQYLPKYFWKEKKNILISLEVNVFSIAKVSTFFYISFCFIIFWHLIFFQNVYHYFLSVYPSVSLFFYLSIFSKWYLRYRFVPKPNMQYGIASHRSNLISKNNFLRCVSERRLTYAYDIHIDWNKCTNVKNEVEMFQTEKRSKIEF